MSKSKSTKKAPVIPESPVLVPEPVAENTPPADLPITELAADYMLQEPPLVNKRSIKIELLEGYNRGFIAQVVEAWLDTHGIMSNQIISIQFMPPVQVSGETKVITMYYAYVTYETYES